jgi:dTDP-4-dehydrorhamnose 3,5-epimerase|tara:strand:+ start:7765 stop:8313 length:549 start_codon:yes stop_codon:yes gene_type:complete
MNFLPQVIPDVYLLEPEPYSDERGLLRRHFCQNEFAEAGLFENVCQSNISENPRKGTLRGFHFQQSPNKEAKVLSVVKGAIYDIVVDLRSSSSTYLSWTAFELNESNRLALYVPPGCSNAWLTMEADTWIHYYHSEFYSPASEAGIRYDDPFFGFEWPDNPTLVSQKDREYALFSPDKPLKF